MRTIAAILAVSLLGACGSDSDLKRVNDAPEARITAPTEGEIVRQGLDLSAMLGTVADSFDDAVDMKVAWQMDDGEAADATVAAGGAVTDTFDASALSLGEHTLLLSATDSDGESGMDDVRFIVAGPLGAPTVEITAPDDGSTFTLGDSITFTGIATDETSPAEDLAFVWASDRDGELAGAITGGGQSALVTADLTSGVHQISLSVTDADGEVGLDTITITIGDPEPQPPEPGDLIFSEINVDPSVVADEDGEWVELYNTSGYTLDISGYSFHDDAVDIWIFDASVTVAPHDYLVICANPDATKNGGIPCDAWFYRYPNGTEPTSGLGHGSGMAIANNDDELELTGPDGIDIDVFDYNDTTSDPIEAGMSFGLDPGKLDGVSNDDVDNWCVQTSILSGVSEPGTPGAANDSCDF